MKKKLSYVMLVISLLAIALITPKYVRAEESGSGTSTATPVTTTGAADTGTDTVEGKKRSIRVDKYKKELKEKLSDSMKTRIADRCVLAQGLVKDKTNNNGVASTARLTAYGEIVTKLQSLSAALLAKGVDVTTLDANIVVLQTKIDAFKNANTTYQQALTDLAALDCKTDPIAFKAALSASRTNLQAVFTASKAVRSYLNDTVKVTLKALKDAADTEDKKE